MTVHNNQPPTRRRNQVMVVRVGEDLHRVGREYAGRHSTPLSVLIRAWLRGLTADTMFPAPPPSKGEIAAEQKRLRGERKQKAIVVRLSDELYQATKKFAKRQGASPSVLVRAWLRGLTKPNSSTPTPSTYDIASEQKRPPRSR